MKTLIPRLKRPTSKILFLFLAGYSANTLGVEQLEYELLSSFDDIEIRSYDSYRLASVNVSSDFNSAGNTAFRELFKFISGENREAQKISMTAPVLQKQSQNGWSVSFVMPKSESDLETPEPLSSRVTRETIDSTLIAAIEYSGSWRQSRFITHREKLFKALEDSTYSACGEVIWARYNSPFSIPFMRRNEVMVEICVKAID